MDRRALARSRTTVKKCAQCHGKLGLGWYSLSRSRHSIVSFCFWYNKNVVGVEAGCNRPRCGKSC